MTWKAFLMFDVGLQFLYGLTAMILADLLLSPGFLCMKKVLIFSMLLAGLSTIFHACRKEDNTTPPDLRFPLPIITKDMSGDDIISGKDPESFLGKLVLICTTVQLLRLKKLMWLLLEMTTGQMSKQLKLM